MTLLFTDPLFQRHDTGRHPESAARLKAVTKRLDACGMPGRCREGKYTPLTEAEVRRVHSQELIDTVRSAAADGGGYIDSDTAVSAASFEVGLAAAGACAAAVSAVIAGPEKTALCLVRPPGHHATPTQSMGFCLFNNIALAARRAIDTHKLNRVLIVDWDVHHGNGTQDVFYEDPAVTFFSIHRFGSGFYPGTGAGNETGARAGAGHTLNMPIRYGTSREDYRAAFLHALERAASVSKPELVLVSAGFDSHALDPIGSLGLEVEDFAWLTRLALEIAQTHAAGRLVSCLEGGYNVEALAESVQAHLEALLDAQSATSIQYGR
jgi:acetoin utilization deacetylase AcuC-like enzyme